MDYLVTKINQSSILTPNFFIRNDLISSRKSGFLKEFDENITKNQYHIGASLRKKKFKPGLSKTPHGFLKISKHYKGLDSPANSLSELRKLGKKPKISPNHTTKTKNTERNIEFSKFSCKGVSVKPFEKISIFSEFETVYERKQNYLKGFNLPALKGLSESSFKNSPSPTIRKENLRKIKNKDFSTFRKEENSESSSNQRKNSSFLMQNSEKKNFETNIRLFRKISNKKLNKFSLSSVKNNILHVYPQLKTEKKLLQKIKFNISISKNK